MKESELRKELAALRKAEHDYYGSEQTQTRKNWDNLLIARLKWASVEQRFKDEYGRAAETQPASPEK